jgi:hypothetical protein
LHDEFSYATVFGAFDVLAFNVDGADGADFGTFAA